MVACSPVADAVDGETADGEPNPMLMAPAAPSFYETNPTYVCTTSDDGFWQLSTPAEQDLDPVVLSNAARALDAQPSAYSLLVIRHGFLVQESYFHGSHRSHSNNVHSASKTIVSALVGIAIERGLLKSVDQTLAELLPRYRIKDAATGAISLRDLLTMESGIAWEEDKTEFDIEDTGNWVQAILDLPVTSAPGATFTYSTGNTHLLSAVLSATTGRPLSSFARTVLFQPLGITYEHWGQDPQGISSGGYNLYMTPRALARFALMVHNQGALRGKQLLSATWLKTSVTDRPISPPRGASMTDTNYGYGYGYWLTELGGHSVAKMWGHGGQFVYLIPDADLVVVMTNDTSASHPEPDGDAFVASYIVPAIRTP